MRLCSFLECGRKHDSHGLCKSHNKQLQDGKELSAIKESLSTYERFVTKIDKTGACWVWKGNKHNGYGRFDVTHTKKSYAHRYAYELWLGIIPNGSIVQHSCDNRSCVNPKHLQLTTYSSIAADTFARRGYESRIAELESRIAELELVYG